MPVKGFIIYEMPQFKIKYNFSQSEYIKVLIKKANFECFIMNRSLKNGVQVYFLNKTIRLKIYHTNQLFL